jgi:ferric-dicitrate binding protein FerR (iron transport regulator)
MKRDVNHVLDECLALLGEGRATLEECLARYPEYASDLVPLLEIAIQVRSVSQPTPDPTAFAAGKQRMLRALADKERRQATSPAACRRGTGWIDAVLRSREIPIEWKPTPAPRRALAGALALVLLTIGGLLLLTWPGAGVEEVAHTGRLDQVEGSVDVLPAGSDAWRPASASERVPAGSRIRTGPGSAAVLVFFDGSTTDLEAETEIAVIEMSSPRGNDRVVLLEQTLGQTYSRVQQSPDHESRFEIETPTTLVAVRGTEFSTAVEMDGTTHVAVTEGTVEVTAQETTVVVLVGQKTAVRPGQIPGDPVSIPQATPVPEPTLTPTPMPTAKTVPAPTATPRPKTTAQPADPMVTLQPVGQDASPQPVDVTRTHEPPGLTKTPQPPGQIKTPQPPGREKPKPDHEKKPKPNKKS